MYSVLKNCQQGKLPARINFSPNKPLSTPFSKYMYFYDQLASRIRTDIYVLI